MKTSTSLFPNLLNSPFALYSSIPFFKTPGSPLYSLLLYPFLQTSWIPPLLFTPLSLSSKLLDPPFTLYSSIPISKPSVSLLYSIPYPYLQTSWIPLKLSTPIAFHIITSKYPTTLYIPLQSFSIYVYSIISVFLSFPSFSFWFFSFPFLLIFTPNIPN